MGERPSLYTFKKGVHSQDYTRALTLGQTQHKRKRHTHDYRRRSKLHLIKLEQKIILDEGRKPKRPKLILSSTWAVLGKHSHRRPISESINEYSFSFEERSSRLLHHDAYMRPPSSLIPVRCQSSSNHLGDESILLHRLAMTNKLDHSRGGTRHPIFWPLHNWENKDRCKIRRISPPDYPPKRTTIDPHLP
jgi:hypothetical protein